MEGGLIGRKFQVLDKGHVVLIDYMGSDADICDAARLSYGAGTKSVSDDRTLLRYLWRHKHGTPFEMAEIKLGLRIPMDSWRQMVRHRTASINEYSTRYSEAIDAKQRTLPGEWRCQSTGNKQGSDGFLVGSDGTNIGERLSSDEEELHRLSDAVYRGRLSWGVAREQARKDLPLSTYTEAYWKCDLRNVLGFLSLRLDPHAQKEIQDYARVIARIVQELFPLTWEAFRDYTIDSVTLSGQEIKALRKLLAGENVNGDRLKNIIPNKRERDEWSAKLARIERS